MISTVQYKILEFHDLIYSLNEGLYFLVSFTAVIYCFYTFYNILAKKAWRHMVKLEKVVFTAAMIVSLIFALDMVLAGDVYPDLSPECVARVFAERMSKGKVKDIAKSENSILSPIYYERFTHDWKIVRKDISDVECDADDFVLIEYHYIYRNISDPETCKVVLRTVKILNLLANFKDLEQRDADFEISLIKTRVNSRFLGYYLRWRISGFTFSMSKPYTF